MIPDNFFVRQKQELFSLIEIRFHCIHSILSFSCIVLLQSDHENTTIYFLIFVVNFIRSGALYPLIPSSERVWNFQKFSRIFSSDCMYTIWERHTFIPIFAGALRFWVGYPDKTATENLLLEKTVKMHQFWAIQSIRNQHEFMQFSICSLRCQQVSARVQIRAESFFCLPGISEDFPRTSAPGRARIFLSPLCFLTAVKRGKLQISHGIMKTIFCMKMCLWIMKYPKLWK